MCRIVPGDIIELLFDKTGQYAFQVIEASVDGGPSLAPARLVHSISALPRPAAAGPASSNTAQQHPMAAAPGMKRTRAMAELLQTPGHATPLALAGTPAAVSRVPWHSLPEQAWATAFQFLALPEVLRCARVCRTWHQVIRCRDALARVQLGDVFAGQVPPVPLIWDTVARSIQMPVRHLSLAGCAWATAADVMTCIGVRMWYSKQLGQLAQTPAVPIRQWLAQAVLRASPVLGLDPSLQVPPAQEQMAAYTRAHRANLMLPRNTGHEGISLAAAQEHPWVASAWAVFKAGRLLAAQMPGLHGLTSTQEAEVESAVARARQQACAMRRPLLSASERRAALARSLPAPVARNAAAALAFWHAGRECYPVSEHLPALRAQVSIANHIAAELASTAPEQQLLARFPPADPAQWPHTCMRMCADLLMPATALDQALSNTTQPVCAGEAAVLVQERPLAAMSMAVGTPSTLGADSADELPPQLALSPAGGQSPSMMSAASSSCSVAAPLYGWRQCVPVLPDMFSEDSTAGAELLLPVPTGEPSQAFARAAQWADTVSSVKHSTLCKQHWQLASTARHNRHMPPPHQLLAYATTDMSEVPPWLHAWSHPLQSLDLTGCTRVFTSFLPLLLSYMPMLQELNLTGCCQLQGSDVAAALPWLPNLRSLVCDYMLGMTDLAVQTAGHACAELRTLSIVGCKDVTDAAFCHPERGLFQHAQQLQHLNLRGCHRLGDRTLRALARSPCATRLCKLNMLGNGHFSADALAAVVVTCQHVHYLRAEAWFPLSLETASSVALSSTLDRAMSTASSSVDAQGARQASGISQEASPAVRSPAPLTPRHYTPLHAREGAAAVLLHALTLPEHWRPQLEAIPGVQAQLHKFRARLAKAVLETVGSPAE